MAAGQKRNTVLVPAAQQALQQLKQEVASELGIQNYQGYLGDVPARLNGAVGGNMVRRMIAAVEQALIQQTASQVQAGFQQGLNSSLSSSSSPRRNAESVQRPVPPAQ